MEDKKTDWEKIFKETSGQVDDLICHLNKDGNILYINHRFEGILDLISSDVIGTHYSNYCHPGDLQRIEREMKKILSGESTSFIINLKKPTGKVVKTRAFAKPIGLPTSENFLILIVFKGLLRKQRIEMISVRRAKLLDFLYHFESEFSGISKISDAYKNVVDLIGKKLSVAYCGLYIKDNDSNDYILLYHTLKQSVPNQLLTLSGLREAYIRKVSYIGERPGGKSPLNRFFDIGMDCLFTVPFNCANESRGIIILGGDSGSDLDLRDISFFKTLGARFSGVLSNLELFKKVEKAKIEWESTFDAIRDPVVIINMDGIIVRANISALEFFSNEDCLGKVKYTDIFNYHAVDGFNPPLRTLKSGKKSAGLLFDLEEGKYFYVNSYPILKRNGRIEKVVVSHKDITLFVETFSRNELLALALKSTKDSIVIFDPDYKILFVNNAVQNVFGYSPDEILGEDFRELFFKRFSQEQMENVISGITNKGWECEIIQENKLGETFPSLISLSPAFNDDGELVMILASIRDITREKDTHQKLIQSEKLRAMGEMISCIVHELKNPLTGIIGFAEIVKRKVEDYKAVVGYSAYQPPDFIEEINLMHKQAERAYYIVRDLLTFAHSQKPDMQKINLNDLLRETLDLVKLEMEQDDVEIRRTFNPDLRETSGNPYQLQQVFINILTNGRQALRSVDRKRIIHIKTSEYNGYILVEISNNGPGIPIKYLGNIFDPFFTTKKICSGTGLGLSLSYGIIKNHDGDILVKNNEEYGVTFLIKLPIQTVEEYNFLKESTTGKLEKDTGYDQLSVLVVDDEESICKLIKQILELMEFRNIDVTNSGNEALEMLRNKRYNLLITDINLPDVNGIELYKKIEVLGIPMPECTIFTSGEIIEDLYLDVPENHTFDYLKKPFSVNDFITTIKSLLLGNSLKV